MNRRASDYEFIPVSSDAIEQQVEAMYLAITGRAVKKSSPEMLFCRWVTSIMAQFYANINIAGNKNIPSRATGKDLDTLGQLFFVKERPGAQAATVTMRFTISQAHSSVLTIPKGTRVSTSSGTIVFASETDAHIPAGDTTVDVRCVCETSGTVGNSIEAGSIISCVDPFPYYSSCINIDDSDGGSDEATDDEYYDLMVASEDAYSCAGARGAYEYWAKSVSTEISDVVVNSPAAGQVNIYILMSDGTPAGDEIKASVSNACTKEERRPLTDYVSVEDPELITFDVNLTYYVSTPSSSGMAAVTEAVNAAIDKYIAWQCEKLGRDLNPSALIQMVREAGAKRVEVISPVFTRLNDGKNNETPQLAQLGKKNVTNGGYEDE
ncbi:MAG: baseplate J/gp47 family protein [Aristaeellaceae bacterium]